MTKNNRSFIAICKEGGMITGSSRLYQDACVEPLEKVMDKFLKTGSLIYTEIDLLNYCQKHKVEQKLYPEIDKLYLWKASRMVRKRNKELGNLDVLIK